MSAIEYEGITSVSCSIVGVRFATDSPLEGDGFEPSVPRAREDAFRACAVRPSPSLGRERDRGFESCSLRRRVTCEPDFLEQIIHYRLQSLSAVLL